MKDNFMTKIEEGEEKENGKPSAVNETDDVRQGAYDYSYAGTSISKDGESAISHYGLTGMNVRATCL